MTPIWSYRALHAAGILLLAALLLLIAASCGETDAGTKVGASTGEDGGADRSSAGLGLSPEEIMKRRANSVFASIPGYESDHPNNLVSAAELAGWLGNPDKAESLFLLDTRPRNEWETQGHIQGATWIKMQEVAEPENLANLPKDKLIICISPTGHTAVQVASVLRWLGYNAAALEFGMAGWTSTSARQIITGDVENGMAKRYPVSNPPPYSVQSLTASRLETPADAQFEILAAAARNLLRDDVFEKEYPFNHIFADVLYQRLADPVLSQETFLLDIRPQETLGTVIHMAAPHTHIDWRALGEPQNLAQLPRDKLIVALGETGQTAGQVTPILRMLGYNAVTLRSGMTAWTETADSQRTLKALAGADYPVIDSLSQ